MSHCDPLLKKEKTEDGVLSAERKARSRVLSSVFPPVFPFHQDKTLIIFLIFCGLPIFLGGRPLWFCSMILLVMFLGFRFCRNRSVASFEESICNVQQNSSISNASTTSTANPTTLSHVLFYEYAYGVITGIFGLFVVVMIAYGCAHFTAYSARQAEESAWRVP
jgi:hypothetical protein